MKVLKGINNVQGRDWIDGTMVFVSKCPEDLYDLLVRHPYDPSAYEVIMEQ